jgi:hypothetical protein
MKRENGQRKRNDAQAMVDERGVSEETDTRFS